MATRDPTRRRRILEVARRHFSAHGYRGTRLDAIADEAGCAKGALYLEFADKAALLRAVVDEVFAAVRSRFAAEVLAIESPLARLGETLRFAHREFLHEPLFARLLRDDPELRALGFGAREDDAAAARAQTELLAGWVDEGIARGEIRADVDRDIVPYAIGVLRFAPQHLTMTGALGLMSRDRVLDGLVELFVAGLAARPEAAATAKKSTAKKKTTKKTTKKTAKKTATQKERGRRR